jgi:hypothetical protein
MLVKLLSEITGYDLDFANFTCLFFNIDECIKFRVFIISFEILNPELVGWFVL